jgi:hypothetical protein
MAKMPPPKNVKELVPDFDKWPKTWMGLQEDLEYGEKLLPIMESFLRYLIDQDQSRKNLKDYADSLWLLGGRIIKEVSIYKEYKKDPAKKLIEAVEGQGCLPDGHEGMSKSELASFEKMCSKFEEFLIKTSRGANHGEKTTAERNLRDMQGHGNQKGNPKALAKMPAGQRKR